VEYFGTEGFEGAGKKVVGERARRLEISEMVIDGSADGRVDVDYDVLFSIP